MIATWSHAVLAIILGPILAALLFWFASWVAGMWEESRRHHRD